jgi:hypothetical protein
MNPKQNPYPAPQQTSQYYPSSSHHQHGNQDQQYAQRVYRQPSQYPQATSQRVGLPGTVTLPVAPLSVPGMGLSGRGQPNYQRPPYPSGYSATVVRDEASKRDQAAVAAVKELQVFRKRKSLFKLPDGSKRFALLPQSKLFTQLQDAERRVDNEIVRRRNDILELYGVSKPVSEEQLSLIAAARRVVRVYIFGNRDKNDDTWSLTIHGRVLLPECAVDGMHPGGGGSVAPQLHNKLIMFTQCLKSLQIDLIRDSDGAGGPENECIFWEKCKQDEEPGHAKQSKDSRFQIVRQGGCPSKVRIKFEVDHVKSMYSLPDGLEELLGLPSGLGKGLYSIPYIMGHIWNHAKRKGLLVQVGEVSKLKLDKLLADLMAISYKTQGKVFHAEDDQYVSYSAFSKSIQAMLTPSEPFTIEYLMDNPDPFKPLCFDFHYEAPLMTSSQPALPPSLLERRGMHNAEMEDLDVDLAELYHKFCEHEAAHAILQSFALDPHHTMRQVLALHNKDPRVNPMLNTRGNEDAMEIMSQSAPYKDPWVEDAIVRYLADAKAEVERRQRPH